MCKEPGPSSSRSDGKENRFFSLGEHTGLRLKHFGSVIYRKKLFDFRELNHFATLLCRLLQEQASTVQGLAGCLGDIYKRPEEELARDIQDFLNSLPPGYLRVTLQPPTEEGELGYEDVQKLMDELEKSWEELPEQLFYSAPLQFHWEITKQCNLSCLHCYASAQATKEGKVDTLDWEKCLELLDTLAKMGVAQINFLGGEPLIEERFLELLEETVSRGMDITFPSNGTLLDQATLDRLWTLGMRYLTISLDSHDPQTFEKIRGRKGVFETVTDTIQRAREKGFDVIVNAVLTKLNSQHFPRLIELLLKLEVKVLKVIDEFPVGRGMANLESLSLSPQEYQDFYNFMLGEIEPRYRDRLDIRLNPRFTFLGKEGKKNKATEASAIDYRCSAGRSQCFCSAEGDIYPCYLFYGEKEFLAGNIFKHPFDEIWKDEKSFSYFRELAGSVPDCEPCPFVGNCKGGCRGEVYKLTGDFFAKNPFCWQP